MPNQPNPVFLNPNINLGGGVQAGQNDANQNGPQNLPNAGYVQYEAYRFRWRDDGKRSLPVAGPSPQTAQIVQLHAPIEREIVTFTVGRDGALPAVPSYNALQSDQNYVFERAEWGGCFQQPQLDGRMRYIITGTYFYLLKNTQGQVNGMNLGLPPWNTYSSLPLEKIPATSFLASLMNTTPVQQTQGQ